MAVMIFDHEHIWCVKKCNDVWVNLDSLLDEPESIPFRSIFAQRKLGRIIVWNDPEMTSNEHSLESYSTVMTPTNRDEEIVSDECLLSSEENEPSLSNSFEKLLSINEDL
jgi:hypothetical protein